MIVILSRTKFVKNTIFVDDKDSTLSALKQLHTTKTRWMDYMDDILKLITINSNNNEESVRNRVWVNNIFYLEYVISYYLNAIHNLFTC